MAELVRVVHELSQLKGALLLLGGGNAYFFNEDWVIALKDILGRTMPLTDVVERLRQALDQAHNPKFREIAPEDWARRITVPVAE